MATNTSILQQQSAKISLLAFSLLALPILVYCWVLLHFSVNIPTYDDYGSLLDFVNLTLQETDWKKQFWLLATPENGHIPFITRALLLLQYHMQGTASFYASLVISGFGWIATALLLVGYGHWRLQLPWLALVPIPFFLLALGHWEAIDFLSSALQMYWGSGFFAVLGLLLVVERHQILASLCLLVAIFCSGGSVAAYPVSLLFLLGTRRWKDLIIFLACTLLVCSGYVFINPPANHTHALPSLSAWLLYTLEFIGNVVGSPQWDLSPLAIQHRISGAILLLATGWLIWRTPGYSGFKLVFCYIVVLGMMAAYMRIDTFAYVVSRYAMYALLGAACSYGLLLGYGLQTDSRITRTVTLITALISIALWAYSVKVCMLPLQQNHDQRMLGMQHFIDTGSPEKLNAWNIERARQILEVSQDLGVYDYQKSLH